MPDDKPQVHYLKDYRPSDYLIDSVEMHFDLGETGSTVRAATRIRRAEGAAEGVPLLLNGKEMELLSLSLDGTPLPEDAFELGEESLTILAPPAEFTLETEVRIHPESNTSLEGLYRSGGNFCTQCEAEGFRKITYFLDRPDVMARYAVTIEADKDAYPVLLSNGNLVEEKDLGGGRHMARWEDPYPKPSYLFALVAGQLVCNEDRFTTASGRDVTLRIWVREGDLDRTGHAMRSLIKAMRWDEDTWGLEYDLDIFNIVAVDDFNMGAMENKSLNIFNSKYVLADEATATDADYINVEGVIAHEYFHNWTGNRVTLSSWFQLSLKEGLTVFRDQEFTSDMNSRPVKRIDDVQSLRTAQFPEDAGPMAHPVRPPSYIEMNNFYTMTVYEKGAELIRMIHTLIGAGAFRRGMDLYFRRHDGHAVTCDDFVAAMEDASGRDLSHFKLWYDQAGTPELRVRRAWEPAKKTFTLKLEQSLPKVPGSGARKPMHIPVALGLLDSQGREMPLRLEGEEGEAPTHRVLDFTEAKQQFVFTDLEERPVPSLLRGFSAPVRLDTDLSHEELGFLMGHDTDLFNRWEAGQQLATDIVLGQVADHQAGRPLALDPQLRDAFERILSDRELDASLAAQALSLPDKTYLAELMDVVDPVALHEARKFQGKALGAELRELFLARYEELSHQGPYEIDPASMGRRSLRNLCLGYLLTQEDEESRALAWEQFTGSGNMTETFAPLAMLASHDVPERRQALDRFYETWKNDTRVLDKWFAIQARSPLPGTLDEVRSLLEHPAYDMRNPNKVRALLGAFAHGNQLRFHEADGSGYAFAAEQILAVDALNPQVAARQVGAFNRWRKFDENRQALMREQLERLVEHPGLSKNVYEIVSRALEPAGSPA